MEEEPQFRKLSSEEITDISRLVYPCVKPNEYFLAYFAGDTPYSLTMSKYTASSPCYFTDFLRNRCCLFLFLNGTKMKAWDNYDDLSWHHHSMKLLSWISLRDDVVVTILSVRFVPRIGRRSALTSLPLELIRTLVADFLVGSAIM